MKLACFGWIGACWALPLVAFAQIGPAPSTSSVDAATTQSFMPVHQAFQPSLRWSENGLELTWAVEPGYYLYRERFDLTLEQSAIGAVAMEEGELKFDPFFQRNMEIYPRDTRMHFPAPANVDVLHVEFQGCAEAGYCYPPETIAFGLDPLQNRIFALGTLAPSADGNDAPTAADRRAAGAGANGSPRPALLIGVVAGFLLLAGVMILAIRRRRS